MRQLRQLRRLDLEAGLSLRNTARLLNGHVSAGAALFGRFGCTLRDVAFRVAGADLKPRGVHARGEAPHLKRVKQPHLSVNLT